MSHGLALDTLGLLVALQVRILYTVAYRAADDIFSSVFDRERGLFSPSRQFLWAT
jgi:hypothetical protein